MGASLDLIRLSDAYLASLTRVTPVGIFHTALDGRVNYVNERCLDIFGLAFDAAYDHQWVTALHPEDRDQVFGEWLRCAAAGQEFAARYRIVRRGDDTRAVHVRVAPVYAADGQPQGFVGTVEDVTDRLDAERALRDLVQANLATQRQLEMLSRTLLHVQEQERRDIAREIHDDIGQVLTALKLRLEMLRTAPATEIDSQVTVADTLISDLVASVRRLMLSLRPPLLDELGLAAALAAHCERFSTSTGVTVDCELHDIEDQRYSPELEAALFRIGQESLTNVARHSGAGSAQLTVRRRDSRLELQVTDRGRGFDPMTVPGNTGLRGMRERATMLGGTLNVTSSPGQGTTILAAVPIGPEN